MGLSGQRTLKYLNFERSEGDDGVYTLEAVASTLAAHHGAVMDEVACVLDWARQRFAHTRGPVEDGNDWDHDLQVVVEGGRWHTVSLTITGSQRFADDWLVAWGGDNAHT